MVLESYIRTRSNVKDILLMTHIVLGYPSFEDSFRIIEAMVEAGVDLVELQIPFSEPIADGPVILRANQKALARGATVQDCLNAVKEVTQAFDIPFIIMSYYNILFRYGVDRFVFAMAKKNVRGIIIPDLSPEEGQGYLEAMRKGNLAPIFLFSPTTPDKRMRYLASLGRGFIYCVARRGTTGQDTRFSKELARYLARCRNASNLPLALGFGVKEKKNIDYLKGKADIAVIGTQTIRIIEREGVASVGSFIRSLG
jgi:tryptophan synthase alpha chain